MISVGIIWNSANQYREEILADIGSLTKLMDSFEVELGENYTEFVQEIYSSENMEQWKIDKKLNHMETCPSRKITILFFDFDESQTEYHPFKKKQVFSQLENCKRFIREKYKDYVENYTFDIVFHATDNLDELKGCTKVIGDFLERKKLSETGQQKLALISPIIDSEND